MRTCVREAQSPALRNIAPDEPSPRVVNMLNTPEMNAQPINMNARGAPNDRMMPEDCLLISDSTRDSAR